MDEYMYKYIAQDYLSEISLLKSENEMLKKHIFELINVIEQVKKALKD